MLGVAAGCASDAPAVSLVETPPPLAEFLARYQNGRVCDTLRRDLDLAGTKHPCAPVFPRDLIARGYEAECNVRFRINPEGIATEAAGACQVFGAVSPEWDAFANAAFPRLAEMAVLHTAYGADPRRRPSATFAQRFVFALE